MLYLPISNTHATAGAGDPILVVEKLAQLADQVSRMIRVVGNDQLIET